MGRNLLCWGLFKIYFGRRLVYSGAGWHLPCTAEVSVPYCELEVTVAEFVRKLSSRSSITSPAYCRSWGKVRALTQSFSVLQRGSRSPSSILASVFLILRRKQRRAFLTSTGCVLLVPFTTRSQYFLQFFLDKRI